MMLMKAVDSGPAPIKALMRDMNVETVDRLRSLIEGVGERCALPLLDRLVRCAEQDLALRADPESWLDAPAYGQDPQTDPAADLIDHTSYRMHQAQEEYPTPSNKR